MTRYGRTTLALLGAALLVPAMGQAQQETPQTRDAGRSIGLAAISQTPERRRPHFEQAIAKVREGLQRTPDNAKLYLLLGQAQAGLGEYAAADSAFTRALQMHPPYAEEIEIERRSAWNELFNQGVEYMGAEQLDQAIEAFEMANRMHSGMPEAFLNLGSLYIHQNRFDDAIRVYEGVLSAVNGPMAAELDEELRAAWSAYGELARINTALVLGGQGVGHFQDENYRGAADAFKRAAEANPYGRDYRFNYAQALYAQSRRLTEERTDETPAERRAEIERELRTLLDELQAAVERVAAIDPLNDQLNLLMVEAHRGRASMVPEAERGEWQQRTLAALQRQEALRLTVDNLQVTAQGGTAQITGELRNVSAEAGTPITLRVTLLSINGATIGTETITINAPEPEATTTFEASVATEGGELAGWKYEVVS
jgi:tetratricopeptide (TPR) repeat protein